MRLRRRRNRRSSPWVCQRGCGEVLHVAGSPEWGAQILKCPACNHMDRRLPNERREGPYSNPYRLDKPAWLEPLRQVATYTAWLLFAIFVFYLILEVVA